MEKFLVCLGNAFNVHDSEFSKNPICNIGTGCKLLFCFLSFCTLPVPDLKHSCLRKYRSRRRRPDLGKGPRPFQHYTSFFSNSPSLGCTSPRLPKAEGSGPLTPSVSTSQKRKGTLSEGSSLFLVFFFLFLIMCRGDVVPTDFRNAPDVSLGPSSQRRRRGLGRGPLSVGAPAPSRTPGTRLVLVGRGPALHARSKSAGRRLDPPVSRVRASPRLPSLRSHAEEVRRGPARALRPGSGRGPDSEPQAPPAPPARRRPAPPRGPKLGSGPQPRTRASATSPRPGPGPRRTRPCSQARPQGPAPAQPQPPAQAPDAGSRAGSVSGPTPGPSPPPCAGLIGVRPAAPTG